MEEEFHWWCIHSGQAIKSKNFNEWHHVSIASANSKSPHLLVNIQGASSESLSEATSKTPPGQCFLVHIHPPALIHLIHWYMNLEPNSFGKFVGCFDTVRLFASTCMFSQKRTNGWIPYALPYIISRMSFNVLRRQELIRTMWFFEYFLKYTTSTQQGTRFRNLGRSSKTTSGFCDNWGFQPSTSKLSQLHDLLR